MKRILTEPIEIFATGDNYAAKGLLFPDGKVKLLKGSILCPYATNSTRPRIVSLRTEILKRKAIGTTLTSDVYFDNHSEAASVLCGSMRNGNEVFRTVDNIPLGEYVEPVGVDTPKEPYVSDDLKEGRVIEAVQTKYERNRQARAECIRIYGAKCAICGFDFKEAYGDDFEGIIQVHHIVPISEIGEEYKIKPSEDLIPVCPNCHVALHSRKGGVYTPEELRRLMEEKRNGR